jgi:transcriptional regulator with XRE-family HTH domain
MVNPNQRIIFGLKVKQYRLAKGLSFSELSESSGISVSYLNEIEKGKKYPKGERIIDLAQALGTNPDELTSLELSEGLAPVGELLASNFLNELPLDLFGIAKMKVVEIIANAPKRVGAFISTLVDLARNYHLGEENFYFGALRSYLEMHHNYFPELEAAVDKFIEQHHLPPNSPVEATALQTILQQSFGYQIRPNGLDAYPELQGLRSLYIPKSSELLLSGRLNATQLAFQLGKELGFQYLGLKERANTSSLLRVQSFDEALNHFKAGYFSAALLLPRERIRSELAQFFRAPKWDPAPLYRMMDEFRASPEMLFQRLTNVLPEFFGLKRLFLIRIAHTKESDKFRIDKELHLSGRHNPHENGLFEHYCRRWLSIDLIRKMDQAPGGSNLAAVQRSHYHGTEDSFLCFTIARPAYPDPGKNVSITIGLAIDEQLKRQVSFWNDAAIPDVVVNNTCERCPILDCDQRVVDPNIVEARNQRREVQRRLQDLLGGS